MIVNREHPLSVCRDTNRGYYSFSIEACLGAHFTAITDAWEGGADTRGALCIEEPSPPVTPTTWQVKVVRKGIPVEDRFRRAGHFGDRSTGIHYVYVCAQR